MGLALVTFSVHLEALFIPTVYYAGLMASALINNGMVIGNAIQMSFVTRKNKPASTGGKTFQIAHFSLYLTALIK